MINSGVSSMSLKAGYDDGMIPIPLGMRLRASVCQPLDSESLLFPQTGAKFVFRSGAWSVAKNSKRKYTRKTSTMGW